MFCPKCGSKNPDQAAFCSSCGINLKALNSSGTASAADKTYHNEKNRTELRKKEIEKLSMIIEYFSKIPARYYAYDNTPVDDSGAPDNNTNTNRNVGHSKEEA